MSGGLAVFESSNGCPPRLLGGVLGHETPSTAARPYRRLEASFRFPFSCQAIQPLEEFPLSSLVG